MGVLSKIIFYLLQDGCTWSLWHIPWDGHRTTARDTRCHSFLNGALEGYHGTGSILGALKRLNDAGGVTAPDLPAMNT